MGNHLKSTAGFVALGSLLLLGGCATPDYMNFSEVTDQAVSKISFVAPNAEMRLLRSKYIAIAVGLYGVWAVEKHSGDHLRDDAAAILERLDAVEEILHANWEKQKGRDSARPDRTPMFNYTLYVRDALGLVDAATEPARRHYREQVLSAFAGSNPVAAAKTAFDALKNLMEIEAHRGALVIDARNHAIDIISRNRGSIAVPDGAWRSFSVTCLADKGTGDGVPSGGVSPPPGFGGGKRSAGWWQTLPGYMQEKMCDRSVSLRGDELAWMNAAASGTLQNIDVSEDLDWKALDGLFYRACKRLGDLSGRSTGVCDKFTE